MSLLSRPDRHPPSHGAQRTRSANPPLSCSESKRAPTSPLLGLRISEICETTEGSAELEFRIQFPPAGSLPIRLGDTLAWPSPLPPFGEDVPVPGARAALLLLGQGQKLEAGEERGQGGQVAIVVWVRLGVAAADEGIGGDRPAAAELRIALRQHRTLVEPGGLQDAPDLGEAAADIAHRTVKDDVPRQHIVEALVGEGQRVGIALAQA